MRNKIYKSGTELTGVKSVQFREALNSGTDLRPGCVGSASIEVEAFGTQQSAVAAGDALTYELNGQTIGIFYAEPSIKTKNSYRFTAFDAAAKLDTDFSPWLLAHQEDFPMTRLALVQAACTVAGVTLSGGFNDSSKSVNAFYADNISCRDILSYAAELGCQFVRCNAAGALVFGWYTEVPNTRIYPSAGTSGQETRIAYRQDGLHYENYLSVCERVAVFPVGEDDVAYIYPTSASGNTLEIRNNPLLTDADAAVYNAAAQRIYNGMLDYRPAQISLFSWESNFRAGQIVNVTDSQNVSFQTPVMSLTVSESGAELESTGAESYSGESSTAKELVQLASDIVRIKKLKVDWAEIGTAIINYLTANNVTAQNLTIVDENGNVLATYDARGITLGQTSEAHAEMDFNSFEIYSGQDAVLSVGNAIDADGKSTDIVYYTGNGTQAAFRFLREPSSADTVAVEVNGEAAQISRVDMNLNYVLLATAPADGASVVVTYKTNDPAFHYDLGQRKSETSIGNYSIIGGTDNEASNSYAVALDGLENKATGRYSFIGNGYHNVASGQDAVVVGGNLNKAGLRAFVGSGQANTASGGSSVVCGGDGNIASGMNAAICGGSGLVAKGYCQFVFGQRNEEDPATPSSDVERSTYVEIVGNGVYPNRSNARTLDWQGNEVLAGTLTIEGSRDVGAELDSFYYAAGETETINQNLVIPGLITSTRAQLIIDYHTEKSMKNISTVSVTNLNGTIRGVNGYVDNVTSAQSWLSGYTVTAAKVSNHVVRITIVKSAAFDNTTNNTPVTYFGYIGLSFS